MEVPIKGLRCDLTVAPPIGPERHFTLRAGGVVRVGRKPSCNVPLDFDGVSAVHSELLLLPPGDVPGAASEGHGLRLCIRDASRNGTAVRLGEADGEWDKLSKGVLRELCSGSQLKIPLRSRQGATQLSQQSRILTLTFAFKVEAVEPDVPQRAPQPGALSLGTLVPTTSEAAPVVPPDPASEFAAPFAEAEPESDHKVEPAMRLADPPKRAESSPEPEAPGPPPKKKRKAPTESQTRKDAVAAFWAQQLPHTAVPATSTAAVAIRAEAVAPKDGRKTRTRSRSRAQALLSIPRDLSVSPISEPGVLKKRRKKKQSVVEKPATLELRKPVKSGEEKKKKKASKRDQ